ncbi:MAG: quinolinate synthase NadA, partial [Desulfomonilia bacterium]
RRVFEWAFKRSDKIFFMPDMNLGTNTARQMGIPDGEIVVWDPEKPTGGISKQALARARVVLWKGWCPVHWPQFRAEDIRAIRQEYRGVRVVVHPESDPETVEASDMSGSTARILEIVSAMEPGGKLAIGTETNLVRRAARRNPSLQIIPLKEAFCEDMAKITLPKLAEVLLHLDRDDHRVTVEPGVAGPALLALERMLEVQP